MNKKNKRENEPMKNGTKISVHYEILGINRNTIREEITNDDLIEKLV